MKNYVLPDFQTPPGIDSKEKVRLAQRQLGVNDDGVWGPKTQAAYKQYLAAQPTLSTNSLNAQRNNPSLDQNSLEQIIRTLPGTTNPTIQTNDNSALKLHTMINASTLGPSLKSRAKFTIDALDKERQDELLLNVMLDGVDTYFSQEAWDQGAYSLMSANPSKRIHENMLLPGEGQAREALATKLNDVAPMKAVSLAASSNRGSISTEQKSSSSANSHKTIPMAQQDYNKRAADMRQELDTLMRRIRFSNLSEKEKQEAISILGDIGAVGATDMNLNILNQIRQQGLERFFRMLPESSRRQVILHNKQQIRMDLMEELDEVKEEISQIPIWEKIPFMLSERYGIALEREQVLQEKIQNVENALDKVFPEWENVMEIGGIGPVATLRPSPTPTPTPKPTPTPSPMPTPSPTPIPKPTPGLTLTPQGMPKELADHWDRFWEELTRASSENGGLTAEQRYAIVAKSAEYLGFKTDGTKKFLYPEKKEKNDNAIDCSALVKELYRAAGIKLHGSSYDMAENAFNSGWGINKENLRPGDLIFWEKAGNETERIWKGIHHVGIYLYTDDHDQIWIIDSTGSKHGPAVQPLWGDKKRTSTGSLVYGYVSVPGF